MPRHPDELAAHAILNYSLLATGDNVVYPTRKHVPPKVRMLVEFLVAAFRDKSWPD